ncbi:hypothetical protein HMPREF1054_0736 [Haemophilus paraphrohaemolyticus HK411]|uniref:Uncharacterized protein n=1 Tax=Haemophilus paraphrohaemolyticus HK411 TaxID=1095743 RepID=I2NC64_9PAST|nr:hypothetical protein HMPREF1054_0736 [Haemophilus paraphrohaemolyticus HK411]
MTETAKEMQIHQCCVLILLNIIKNPPLIAQKVNFYFQNQVIHYMIAN